MTPEQTDLARRLAEHPMWRLAPGVRTAGGDVVVNMRKRDGLAWLHSGSRSVMGRSSLGVGPCDLRIFPPDLTSDATAGHLLALVWAVVPMAYVERETADYCRTGSPERVSVSGPIGGTVRTLGVGATLGEACAEALLALWGEP